MRNLREADHELIISVIDEWWGRPVSSKLPKLFFRHFEDTSYIVEEGGEVVAFLVGFVSQAREGEAYIHFVGVAPGFRGRGVARSLYERFFEAARGRGCGAVRCITSPVNGGSIEFHRRLGFDFEEGDSSEDGVPVHTDYDGDGKAKVVFAKRL